MHRLSNAASINLHNDIYVRKIATSISLHSLLNISFVEWWLIFEIYKKYRWICVLISFLFIFYFDLWLWHTVQSIKTQPCRVRNGRQIAALILKLQVQNCVLKISKNSYLSFFTFWTLSRWYFFSPWGMKHSLPLLLMHILINL